MHRRHAGPRGSAVVCALALAAACGGDEAASEPRAPRPAAEPAAWPIYRGDPALTGVAAGALGERLELAWTYPTGGAVKSSPVVAAGLVYVGSDAGAVHALDLQTGAPRWSYPTEDIVEAPPLVHDGRVYVGSSDGWLYALDAQRGDLLWKFETGDKILGGANVARGPDGAARIVVGSYDNKLYCFDAASGAKHWEYATDNYVNGTPAVDGDRIVFGGCDAVLHVVSVASGAALARVELGAECYVAGSVALADGAAYFGHYGNAFVRVDFGSGEVAWTYPSESDAFFSSPAIGPDRVVFGGRDRHLHCLRRGDGGVLWTFPTRRKVDGSPVICGDKVVFGAGDGRLRVLRLADGGEVWSHDLGRPLVSSPAVVAGTVVVGCDDGSVYAFRPPEPER